MQASRVKKFPNSPYAVQTMASDFAFVIDVFFKAKVFVKIDTKTFYIIRVYDYISPSGDRRGFQL